MTRLRYLLAFLLMLPLLAWGQSQAPQTGSEDFALPAEGKVVRTFSGGKGGWVIQGNSGDPVLAIADGEVIFAGQGPKPYGNLLIVRHEGGLLSVYAHNRALLVQEGSQVRKGQKIAEMGDSGADRAQLGFELRRNGRPIDPESVGNFAEPRRQLEFAAGGDKPDRDRLATVTRPQPSQDSPSPNQSSLQRCTAAETDLFAPRHNCSGTVTFSGGAKYVGEWRDGQQHGKGVRMWSDGQKYVGEFRDGKFQGQGTYIWPDGAKYVGEYRDDMRNGLGILYGANGSIAKSGRWESGRMVQEFALDTNRFPFNSLVADPGKAERDRVAEETERWTQQQYAAEQRDWLDKAKEAERRAANQTFETARKEWLAGVKERERLAAEAKERERLALEAERRRQQELEQKLAAETRERERLVAEARDRERLAAELEAERKRRVEAEARQLAETRERERLAAEAEAERKKRQELEEKLASAERPPVAAPQTSKPQASFKTERRVALVIGNSTYKVSPLDNPVNDATDMAESLKKFGFQTTLLRNASLAQMREATRRFADELPSADVALIYFAGHGIEAAVSGKNYMIPVSADLKFDYELADQAYDAKIWLDMFESIRSNNAERVNIVILDACRNNTLIRAGRNIGQGLGKMDAPSGTFLAYSTAPGKVAEDGVRGARNSPFTKHLLRAMQQPNMPIEEVFKEVRRNVGRETKGMQVPWESTSLTGFFTFRQVR